MQRKKSIQSFIWVMFKITCNKLRVFSETSATHRGLYATSVRLRVQNVTLLLTYHISHLLFTNVLIFFFQMWLATDHYSFCCRNEMQIKFWNRNKRWFLKKVKITSLQSTLQWDLLWLQIKCSTLCTAAPLWVSV